MSGFTAVENPFVPQLDASVAAPRLEQGANAFLESWLSETVSDFSCATTASPLIATTITLEAIQDLLHANGFPIEATATDTCPGLFEDTQFDAVVDVQTTEEVDFETMESENFKSLYFDAVFCSSDDLSDDELGILPDFVLSPASSVACFSDNDFNSSDSGIEAEMEEPQDGADDTNKSEKNDKNDQKSGDSSQTSGEKQSDLDSTSTSHHSSSQASGTNHSKDKKKRGEKKTDTSEDDVLDFHCQYLWEFLHHLLAGKKYSNIITWKNETKGIFRLLDHNSVARLWGVQKKRKNMTYDKLSRALRYYYSKNILRKVDGQRLTYKFVKNLSGKKYP